jgi:hypothetical protein
VNLLNWAEAVAWICTRSSEDVAALAEIPPSSQLGHVMRAYGVGVKMNLRCGLGEDPIITLSSKGGADFGGAQEALRGLRAAFLAGLLPVRAFAHGSGVLAIVPYNDLADLEWRLWDPAGGPSGLWSCALGRLVWREPVVALPDLAMLWPTPLAGRRSRAATLIRATLLEKERKLKKEDALELAKHCEGYSRAIFEDVWSEFPQDRKFGRGERGASRQKRLA